MDAALYGRTLKQYLAFDGDYSRNDANSYEAYRARAIACLRQHHELSQMRAYCVVDDAIAEHERRCPSLQYKKDEA